MTSQKVSVIIPTYNYGRFVGEAVQSVLAQTFPAYEVIVVDDDSSDNTEEIIAKFGDKVKYIKQKNGGVGMARNTGVKHSSGDFIAFLDADDIWLPQKLERQIQLFQNDNEIGLVTGGMREFGKNGETIAKYQNGQNGWCAENILLFESVTIGPGSTALIKREVFETVGGFDETKEMHPSEDWEFCYRVARIFKLAYLPELLVEYRNHGNNGHLQIPRFERAMLLAFEKTFRDNSVEIQKLKRQSYGTLHKVLAGSYFHARDYRQFIKHSVKSFWLYPQNIIYFAKFPLRRFKNNS
jgi:glycosyltransferase involved in cell wall biosynthesis